MRRILLGAAMALGCLTGIAHAADYIVVSSNEPSIQRGQAFNAGQRIALGAGKTLTVMRASGELATVRGSVSGAQLPGLKVAAADPARLEALRALVAPPPSGRTFGARRGGICPPVAALTDLDAILHAADTGCKAQARQALDAYIAGSAPSE